MYFAKEHSPMGQLQVGPGLLDPEFSSSVSLTLGHHFSPLPPALPPALLPPPLKKKKLMERITMPYNLSCPSILFITPRFRVIEKYCERQVQE